MGIVNGKQQHCLFNLTLDFKKKVNKKIIMHCVLIIYQMPVLEFMTGEARVLSGKKTK